MNILSIVLFLLIPLFVATRRAEAETLPTLKVLSTPNCPACMQMARVLDVLNEKYAGKIQGEKVNLMEHRDLAQQYKVRYVPHLLFCDATGSVVKEKVGYIPLDEVLTTFREAGVSVD
ncbi:MAG: thioredoxin family protein [Synergistaceae bacterium]|jgi:thioredoxin-related protein|nr:thioredoxin family protein [Synergistaceae bacterium]